MGLRRNAIEAVLRTGKSRWSLPSPHRGTTGGTLNWKNAWVLLDSLGSQVWFFSGPCLPMGGSVAIRVEMATLLLGKHTRIPPWFHSHSCSPSRPVPHFTWDFVDWICTEPLCCSVIGLTPDLRSYPR